MIRRLTHLGGARCTIGLPLLLCTVGGDARQAGLAALVGNAFSHAAVQILKRAVGRRRPCDAWGRPLALVDLPDPFSFPSGHAAAAFAVAVPIALTWPWVAPLALALASIVAASRVILRLHHVSDAVAGALLGTLGALAARAVL